MSDISYRSLAKYARKTKTPIPIETIDYKLDDFFVPINQNAYEYIDIMQKVYKLFAEQNGITALTNVNRTCLLKPEVTNGPSEAYDNFIWCSRLTRPLEDTLKEKRFIREIFEIQEYPDMPIMRYGLLRIKPKDANDCYMIDNAVYIKAYYDMIAKNSPRVSLTYHELGELNLKRANTLVPIAKYHGDYEQPILLISRDLNFDEVELAGIFTT